MFKSRHNLDQRSNLLRTHLSRMNYVWWWGTGSASSSACFLIAPGSTAAAAAPSPVNGVLERAALGMGFGVMHLEPHLLEQGSHYRATARPNIWTLDLSKAARSWSSTHCLFRCMGMAMAVVAMDVPMYVVHGTATLLGLRALDLQLLLFSYLLNGHEPLFAHLDSFCHVAHGRILYMPMLDCWLDGWIDRQTTMRFD